jgi:hypothetical protein
MNTTRKYLLSPACDGVEVRTERDAFSGMFVTTIVNGRLDGDTFRCEKQADASTQHAFAVKLAREAARLDQDGQRDRAGLLGRLLLDPPRRRGRRRFT